MQLHDISKTIASAFNISNTYPGINFLSSSLPKNRTRIFSDLIWSIKFHDWGDKRVPAIKKYMINGPLRNHQSWREIKSLSAMKCSTAIDFSNIDHSKCYFDNLNNQENLG